MDIVDRVTDILSNNMFSIFFYTILANAVGLIMYADDLVILSPSVSRLSELMQVGGRYGLNHDIKYNSKKSAVLIFKSN